MLSFIGEYTCKLDHKGRVVIPVAVRKELSEAGERILVLHHNLHRDCINVYTRARWVQMLADFQTTYAALDARESDFIREFSRGSAAVEPDESSGRILIPRKMLDRIGARDELILAGQGAQLEIWEPGRYEEAAFSPDETARVASEMYQRLTNPA
ncbi:MAG: protein mraZ [Odoribacteraceae bacterium]|jgi:MraZ protein|nr:protein mraZ [Odoribacteraceae bacterium]